MYYSLASFKHKIFVCLIMTLEQEIRFTLNLSLAESYIYGTAIMSDKSYLINIQQASEQLVILPTDFFYTEPSNRALVSFGGYADNNTNNNNNDNNKKLIINSEIQVV
jgi:hypothetical protein